MSAGKSRSRLWFLWHSWLALPVWVFLFFVCVTGAIAVISTEIAWLANPAMRASGSGEELAPSAILAAAETAIPGGRALSLSWSGSHMAVGVRLALPDATTATAWVNQYSGAVQGLSSSTTFRGFIRALHGWLLSYPFGWYAVTLLAIPLLGSLITGLVVYKRFWRAFYKPRIRWNQTPRVLLGDMHRVAGVWSIWFVATMAVTSLWFLIYVLALDLGMGLGGGKPPVMLARAELPIGAAAQHPDADAILNAARTAVPDMRVRYLGLPSTAFDPALVIGSSGQAPLLPDYIRVNPYTAQVIDITGGLVGEPGISLTRTIMRALHTGDFGGLPVKLIWFLFGTLLSGLVFTGMLIWTRRTVRATLQTGRQGGPARPARSPSNA